MKKAITTLVAVVALCAALPLAAVASSHAGLHLVRAKTALTSGHWTPTGGYTPVPKR